MTFEPYAVAMPASADETISYANAHAYEWGYRDATRAAKAALPAIPHGWPAAWLEYVRGNPHRMSIQDAFRYWIDTATLPGPQSEVHE